MQTCNSPITVGKIRRSEIGAAYGSGVGEDVADVGDAGQIHDHALEAQAEAGVLAGAEAAQVQVPPVIFGVHAQLFDAGLQHVQALLTLAAADDLADAGDQTVGCGDGLAVVVEAHVECLDVLGIVGDEDGALVDLLGEVALVLGLEIGAPLDLEVKLVVVLHQDVHGLGVGHAAEGHPTILYGERESL